MRPIHDKLKLLRDGNHHGTTNLYSKEEKEFMWNLAFVLTLKHRYIAFKLFYMIRSFITYKGIFMALGYDRGINDHSRTYGTNGASERCQQIYIREEDFS